MNAAATRRLRLEHLQRQRIRLRIAQADARASAGPCQCLACTLLRAVKEAGEEGVVVKPASEPTPGVRH